ncbi:AcrR family transcriptional regulator [Actinoalloteichus hoggarensis]|uniref:Uncharacterized protein n=1 Tax=Actinoalloteichus hoggarensis TaxID=1470176 RepID=A0A221W511_9PSEU|nr:hypothetical protein [Actinoalloteichus hoggarensis]ASO20990.1 hypothetical protein AHOG_16820 [Actinoalloteichus hoggarensis]MBB5920921.1 AcrR family transcriptional regulator [Actinoalloteichus hoggarensis]
MSESRRTAEQRRAAAVEAGLAAFADHGLTTAAVTRAAREIGVSAPYVFRLFGGRRGFFLACLDRLEELQIEAFTGADAVPGESFEQMGARFRALAAGDAISGFSIQAVAVARTDPAVADRYRRLLSRVLRAVARHTGASPAELTVFLARGALIVQFEALSMDLATLTSDQVVESLLADEAP